MPAAKHQSHVAVLEVTQGVNAAAKVLQQIVLHGFHASLLGYHQKCSTCLVSDCWKFPEDKCSPTARQGKSFAQPCEEEVKPFLKLLPSSPGGGVASLSPLASCPRGH